MQFAVNIWLILLIIGLLTAFAILRKNYQKILMIMLAAFMGFILSTIVVERATHHTTTHDIEYYADGTEYEIVGRIVDAPDIRPTITKYIIRVESVKDLAGSSHVVTGKVLVNDSGGWPDYAYGESIAAKGKLERPKPIDDFAYDRYLSTQDIYAIMPRAQISAAHPEQENSTFEVLFGTLISLRFITEDRISRLLPEPHASLLAGLLTGSRRGIPEHLTDDFRDAGITHIVAISGYNVTIILTLFSSFLFWIPRQRRFGILVTAVALFTLFVGSSASVVRAAIMGILGLLALQTGRQANVRLSILWTAFFMLCWNPKYLWYDAGFQLSFLAVIGLAELSEPLKTYMKKVPEFLALRESLVATIAAQIATLPLIMILFQQVSLVAPLTNVVVAPLIPLAMLMGSMGVVLSVLSMQLGLLVSYLTWALLQAIILIAKFCAHLPFAVLQF